MWLHIDVKASIHVPLLQKTKIKELSKHELSQLLNFNDYDDISKKHLNAWTLVGGAVLGRTRRQGLVGGINN